jgi:hypothetical protein
VRFVKMRIACRATLGRNVQTNQVDGLAATHSLFGNIPEAAREQLGVEIARIGYDVLAAQKADVAKRTGELESGLSLKLIDRPAAGAGRPAQHQRRAQPLFYGRIVERGRRAQTVLVQRRRRVGASSGSARAAQARR